MFSHLVPETAPTFFLLMVLGYLERGYLSRPIGGTKAFRDALVASFKSLGGEAHVHATAEEVLVENDRAVGVRLGDGTMLKADVVVSTASSPETVLRLLGARYDADKTRDRLDRWALFEPIVLASYGVDLPYADAPQISIIDGVPPFTLGDRKNDALYVRVCNDDPIFAPKGHTVVQAMCSTRYEWWATRGSEYNLAKEHINETVIEQLAPHFPGFKDAVRMTDLATPLTYWNMARSWRGAFEGWMPSADSFFSHVEKKLRGLDGFYMAGQWVEPGGGVPVAVMSGRQVVELIARDERVRFVAA